MMNNSSFVDLDEDNNVAIAVISSIGAAVFLENTMLLFIIGSVLKGLNSQHSQHEIIIQTALLSFTDGLSGICLLISTTVRVTDTVSALVGTYSSYFSGFFQALLQVDIACICAYRYKKAKHIRKLSVQRKSRFIKCLTVMNLNIAIVQTTLFSLTFKLRPLPEDTNFACTFNKVVFSTQLTYSAILTVCLELVCLLTADILCMLTIFLLRREIRVDDSSSVPSIEAASQSMRRLNVRKQQQTAINVVFLILLIFNISTIPTLIALGMDLTPEGERWVYLSLYIHGLLNPIIISTRILSIRKTVSKAFANVYTKVKTCFSL